MGLCMLTVDRPLNGRAHAAHWRWDYSVRWARAVRGASL